MEINFDAISQTLDDQFSALDEISECEYNDEEDPETENELEQALRGTRMSRIFVKTSSSEEYVSSNEEERKAQYNAEKLNQDPDKDRKMEKMDGENFDSKAESEEYVSTCTFAFFEGKGKKI